MVSRRCPLQHVRMVAHLTGIAQGTLPLRYLGCMLFKGRKTKAHFRYVLDAINKKLMGWSGKWLTPGGRLMLIKHVLSSIPIHVLAALDPPLGVLMDAERIFASFFWGFDGEGRKRRSWRAWSSLTYPIDENGLGLRSLKDVCLSFSAKLWWKLYTHAGCWSRYVHSVSVERSFAYRRLMTIEPLMLSHTRVMVLDGSSSFLSANWTGSGAIMDLLADPPPFLQSARISEIYGENGWDLSMLALYLPAEVVQLVSSFSFPFCGERDKLIWEPTPSGLFSVSSAYQVLRPKRVRRPSLRLIWGPRIPTRLSIFFWRFLNALLPFPDVLQTYGFQLPSKCPCCESVDSLGHFLFECVIAAEIWHFFSGFFPDLIPLTSLQDVLLFCLDSSTPVFLQLLPIFVIWGLWRLRNAIVFDGLRASASWVQFLVMEFFQSATYHFPLRLAH